MRKALLQATLGQGNNIMKIMYKYVTNNKKNNKEPEEIAQKNSY